MALTIEKLNLFVLDSAKDKSHKQFVKNYHFQCNGRTCYFSPRQIFDFYRHGNYVPWNVAPPREGQQSADWTGCTAQTTDVLAERHSCWCLQAKSCYSIKKPFHEFTQIFNHFVLKKKLTSICGMVFKSSEPITEKAVLVTWVNLFGFSIVALTVYLTWPYSPSKEDGMFSGSWNWKG